MGAFKIPDVFTDALPRICRRTGCLEDAVFDNNLCTKHLVPRIRNYSPKRNFGLYKIPIKELLKSRDYRFDATIYFIKTKGFAHVKIGKTREIGQRMKGLDAVCPLALEVVATIQGKEWLEFKMHEYFKSDWVKYEWFKYSKRMKEMIRIVNEGDLDFVLQKLICEGL